MFYSRAKQIFLVPVPDMLYRRSDFTTACAVENGSMVFVMGGFTNDMETYELFTSDVEVLIVADG